MAALQFTRDLAIAIVEGRKSQTLRVRPPRGLTVGGPLTLLNGYHRDALIGRATCIAMDLVERSALDEDDAVRDGFTSLAELQTRLDAMDAPAELYRIRWTDLSLTPGVAQRLAAPGPGRRTRTPRTGDRRRRADRAVGAAER